MADGLDIDHIARLARLRLTPEERALYEGQLSQVLGHFRQLAEADLSKTAAPFRITVSDVSLREDIPGETLGSEAVLRNAPASRDGQISVPRVVDDEA
jgi:aspartyl-tRNA(Asn)/glutamyl-tRNA(Gln) amidotransferase subunit C